MRETWVRSLGWEDPLEKGKATHSSTLAWRIPQTIYSPWGRNESNTTDRLSLYLFNWRITGFTMLCFCRTTRVSCEHTYVPSLSRPPAPHPLPPRRHGASGWAPRAVQQLTAASHWRFYTGGGTCQGCSLDLSHSLLPCCVHKTLLRSYRLSS